MTLWDLAVSLQPKSEELDIVSRSASYLASTIQSKAEAGLIPNYLNLYIIGSILRGTKPSPVNDIDILYVVGEAKRGTNDNHIITKSDYVYISDDYDSDNNISSLFLLNKIKKAISTTYPNSDLRRNHEVVNIYLSSYDLSFDLIPAWDITDSNYYLIPQGEQKHKWKKSNPFVDKDIMKSLDTKTSSTVGAAILITKYWFKIRKIITPRSYHLEAVIYNILNAMQEPTTTLQHTLVMILNNLDYNSLLLSCPDPTGLSEPLTSGLTNDDFNKICETGKGSASLLWNSGEQSFMETMND